MKQHRSKVIVSLLAAVLGVFGAHWWYLRRPHAWLFTLVTLGLLAYAQTFPSWWDNPAFLLLFIPMAAGCIEALVFSLKPDAWFDARYNPGLVKADPHRLGAGACGYFDGVSGRYGGGVWHCRNCGACLHRPGVAGRLSILIGTRTVCLAQWPGRVRVSGLVRRANRQDVVKLQIFGSGHLLRAWLPCLNPCPRVRMVVSSFYRS